MDLDKTILDICNDIKNDKKTAKNTVFGQDQDKKPNKNNDLVKPGFKEYEKRGRKNKGYTKQNKSDYNQYRIDLRNTENIKSFSDSSIEVIQGEIIQDNDLNQFKELYQTTCDCVLEEFKNNNTELCKKHAYMWYKPLLLELKKHVPEVTYKDIDKLYIVWDCLSDLLNSIGLYITIESFLLFTKIYDYQLKNMESVNPKYIDFRKKILSDRDSQLLNEIALNPYNQTNKIFLAKVHGYVEKTEPKTIEVNHNIKNYDNISNYRLSDNGKN